MKTREEKIKKIYKTIADKTLSFGCKFFHKGTGEIWRYSEIWKDKRVNIQGNKIIGHPVMIGDVLDWIVKNIENNEDNTFHFIDRKGFIQGEILTILHYRTNKRQPIEEQLDETISFIYGLIGTDDTN